jgi:hypothetical protein
MFSIWVSSSQSVSWAKFELDLLSKIAVGIASGIYSSGERPGRNRISSLHRREIRFGAFSRIRQRIHLSGRDTPRGQWLELL